jgi:hypothetical protein
MDSEPILKKTLVTVGAMVGACVAFVGTVSLAAVLVTSHVVGPSGDATSSGGANTSTTSTTGAGALPGPRAAHSDSLPGSPASPSHPTSRAHDTTHDTI